MCIFKKKKIANYLQTLQSEDAEPFDMLLAEYLDGSFKRRLQSLEIAKIEIYVDWHEDYKCIGVQGKYRNYYLDVQIYPDIFMVAFDLDEADEDTEYPLTSAEQFFRVLSVTIAHLQT